MLDRHRQRRAVVGAVEQKARQDPGVAGDKTRAQAGCIGALGQAVKDDAALERGVTHFPGGLQQPGRRRGFVVIKLRITLIRGNDEIEALGQFQQAALHGRRHHGAGRVAGRADVNQLAAAPDFIGDAVQIGQVIGIGGGIEEIRLRAGQQRRALVNLIEGIRHQHQRALTGIDHRLGKGEQRLAGAITGQDVTLGIERLCRQVEAAAQPPGDALPQFRQALGGGILGESAQV